MVDDVRVPSARTRVVIAPATRLGTALLDLPAAPGETVLAVTRPGRAGDVVPAPGTVRFVPAYTDDPFPPGTEQVQIHVCALGPVQAREPQHADEEARVAEGLATLEWLLAAAAGRPVQVVLVSSVLALAPPPDRRHYGGWKALVEHRVRARVQAYSGEATLTVLHPGRLVARHQLSSPGSLTSTRYSTLARRMVGAPSEDRARLIGLDARIWALLRAASLVTTSVSMHIGGVRTPSSTHGASTPAEGEGPG